MTHTESRWIVSIRERWRRLSRGRRVTDRSYPHERFLYPLGLLLITLLFFAQPLFHGRISEPLDALAFTYPWAGEASSLFADAHRAGGIQNPFLNDATQLILPFFHYTRAQLLHGHVPLWSPYTLGGTPFLAGDAAAVLYPPNLLVLLLPEATALQALMMLKIFGAGLGMYFFLGALGLRRVAAFLGAVAFMFGSSMVFLMEWQHASVAMWLPWSFLCVEKLLQVRERRVDWFTALAIVTGCHLLGGHAETSAFILLALGVYVGLWMMNRAWSARHMWRRIHEVVPPVLLVGGGIALGIMLAAAQLLPTLHYLADSYPYYYRTHILTGPIVGARSLSNLASWLVPNLHGNPAFNLQHLSPPADVILVWDVGYVGVPTLVLAALSIAHPLASRRFHRYALLMILLLAACLLYGIAPVYTVFLASPLRTLVVPYIFIVTTFSVAALAAFGLDGLLERLGSIPRWHWTGWRDSRLLYGSILALFTICFEVTATVISKTQMLHLMLWLARSRAPVTLSLWGRSWVLFALLLLLVSIVLLALIRAGRVDARLGVIALISLLIGDLFTFGIPYNTQTSPRLLFPSTPITQELQSLGPGSRIIAAHSLEATGSVGETDWPYGRLNLGNVLNVRDLGGYDSVISTRIHAFATAINRGGTDVGNYSLVVFNNVPDRHLLAVAGVTHVLLNTALTETTFGGSHVVFDHGGAADKPLPTMAPGVEEAQTFTVSANGLNVLAFHFSIGDRPKDAQITFRLTDVQTGELLVTRDISTGEYTDYVWLPVVFPPIPNSQGRSYRVSFVPHADAAPEMIPALSRMDTPLGVNEQRYSGDIPVPDTVQMVAGVAQEMDAISPVWRYGSGTLYVVHDTRPRAYIADGVISVQSQDTALSMLDRLHVPGTDAVIESNDSIASNGGAAAITQDEPGDVAVQVRSTAPGILVLNESYGDGGWQATVDGKSTAVLHTNFLFQGIRIPAGEHMVHFRYRPTSFTVGAAISLESGITIVALLIMSMLIRRRKAA